MMRKIIAALSFCAVTGCATVQPAQQFYPAIATQFDPAEVAWFNQEGSNTIRGQAVLRTVGGEAKTCAGLQAYLTPVSSYAEARFRMMYPIADASGYLPANRALQWAETDRQYSEMTRTTVCDAQGIFMFENLPDGEYYVTAQVTWGVPQIGYYSSYMSTEGGALMQRVRVSGGETKQVILSA